MNEQDLREIYFLGHQIYQTNLLHYQMTFPSKRPGWLKCSMLSLPPPARKYRLPNRMGDSIPYYASKTKARWQWIVFSLYRNALTTVFKLQ